MSTEPKTVFVTKQKSQENSKETTLRSFTRGVKACDAVPTTATEGRHRTIFQTIKELRRKQCDVNCFYNLFSPTGLYFLDAISQHGLHFHIHSQLWHGARSVPTFFLNQVFIIKIHKHVDVSGSTHLNHQLLNIIC